MEIAKVDMELVGVLMSEAEEVLPQGKSTKIRQ